MKVEDYSVLLYQNSLYPMHVAFYFCGSKLIVSCLKFNIVSVVGDFPVEAKFCERDL